MVGASWRVPCRQVGGHRMFSEEDNKQIVKDTYRPSRGGPDTVAVDTLVDDHCGL